MNQFTSYTKVPTSLSAYSRERFTCCLRPLVLNIGVQGRFSPPFPDFSPPLRVVADSPRGVRSLQPSHNSLFFQMPAKKNVPPPAKAPAKQPVPIPGSKRAASTPASPTRTFAEVAAKSSGIASTSNAQDLMPSSPWVPSGGNASLTPPGTSSAPATLPSGPAVAHTPLATLNLEKEPALSSTTTSLPTFPRGLSLPTVARNDPEIIASIYDDLREQNRRVDRMMDDRDARLQSLADVVLEQRQAMHETNEKLSSLLDAFAILSSRLQAQASDSRLTMDTAPAVAIVADPVFTAPTVTISPPVVSDVSTNPLLAPPAITGPPTASAHVATPPVFATQHSGASSRVAPLHTAPALPSMAPPFAAPPTLPLISPPAPLVAPTATTAAVCPTTPDMRRIPSVATATTAVPSSSFSASIASSLAQTSTISTTPEDASSQEMQPDEHGLTMIPGSRFIADEKVDVSDILKVLTATKRDYAGTPERERVHLLDNWNRTVLGRRGSPFNYSIALETLLPPNITVFYRDYATAHGEGRSGYAMASRLAYQIALETRAPLDRIGILYRQDVDESVTAYFARVFAQPESRANVDEEHRRDAFTRAASGVLDPAISTRLCDMVKEEFSSPILGRPAMCWMPSRHFEEIWNATRKALHLSKDTTSLTFRALLLREAKRDDRDSDVKESSTTATKAKRSKPAHSDKPAAPSSSSSAPSSAPRFPCWVGSPRTNEAGIRRCNICGARGELAYHLHVHCPHAGRSESVTSSSTASSSDAKSGK